MQHSSLIFSHSKKIVVTLSAGILIGVAYHTYVEQQRQSFLLEKIKQEICAHQEASHQAERSEESPAIIGSIDWSKVHNAVRNTVVQVVVHSALFNWLEPYKTPQQKMGFGSGFFIDESGLLITNAHVIDQFRAVYIQIPHFGKRRFDVEVIGVCPDRDLALLKVIPEDLAVIVQELGKLPILKFGDSDNVHRADEIMTLGYPLGQESLKSTVGVVSGRQHMAGHALIQIDAPINPGNSGGPSLNKEGKVIGVNSSGILEGGVQNVGYIITSNEVKLFLKQLEDIPADGGIKFLRKPFIGIIYGIGSDTITQYLNNPLPGGLYIVEVYPGSPLDKAGVQAGDMLYEIDGHRIDYFGDLQTSWSEDRISVIDYVSRLMPGEKIHIVVYRKGKRKELIAQFDFSTMPPVRMRYPGYENIDYEVIGGMVVMDVSLNHVHLLIQRNAHLVKYAELEDQLKSSVMITHVLPDSEASKTRVLADAMIIKEVNGKPTTNLEEFRKNVVDSMATGFLTIRTEGKVFTVLPFGRVLRDEPKLASTYFYNITPFTQRLIKQSGML
jgi:serine protease Do